MLILPWDAAVDTREWQDWVASTERFGLLTVNNLDRDEAPLAVPTHFTLAGDQILLHLDRVNPVWPHLEAAAQVRLAMTGDYAYVPGHWRTAPGQPEADGVPTSYYAAVQFVCRPAPVDDPQGKADILEAQVADLQPEGRHAKVSVDEGPYWQLLPGLRGLRLAVLRVEAKFKFDDHKPVAHRERVSRRLRERAHALDVAAADQQRRRVAVLGDWRARRDAAPEA